MVLTGKDGKLLVDAGFSVSQPRISAALDSISQDPIRHLINRIPRQARGNSAKSRRS